MNIIKTEDYEDLAIEWQWKMIEMLKYSLKKNGVSIDVSQKVCEDFIFDFSMIHDQGEVKDHLPFLCFKNARNENLMIPNDQFSLHDYVFGNISEIFNK